MLTTDDSDFIAGPFQRFEGWCHDEAAAITLHLQRFQLEQGWVAPSYEIGVFQGKYLSVLHRAATLAGQRTTGIDLFTAHSRDFVAATLERELRPQGNLALIERDSSLYSPAELIAAVGGAASWISVDGDHSAEGVGNDLRNAEATLSAWGVIAVDDFLNAMAIGVVEGSVRYLSSSDTRLVPFCFCANKLLVTFPEQAELYRAQIPLFCEQNQHLPRAKNFVHRRATLDPAWTSQRLFGHPVWLMP